MNRQTRNSEKPLSYLEEHGKVSAMLYFIFLYSVGGFGCMAVISAYFDDGHGDVSTIVVWGPLILFVFSYEAIFGFDKLVWIFVNGFLGIVGVVKELDILLYYFGKDFHSFSAIVHVAPIIYYVFFTFLIRQAAIDFCNARNKFERERLVNIVYVLVSLLFYSFLWWKI